MRIDFVRMGAAGAFDALCNATALASAPWAVLPLLLCAFGLAPALPLLTLGRARAVSDDTLRSYSG